jgi:hypothetical protein
MYNAYVGVTVVLALLLVFSALGKLRRDERVVKVIHEQVGVPMKYFVLLAACEITGAVGLVAGIWWPLIGLAAGIGVVLYFLGALGSHLRVADLKGLGPAAFMLTLAAAALVLRSLTMRVV